jgi:ABC-type multidrug transport system fused ATPase/permease subunit
VAAIALYAMQLTAPVDELIAWTDELQLGATALSRLLGVSTVPSDREADASASTDSRIVLHQVRFEYTPGVEVLHGIELDLRPGERLAVVGPSGSGKSTLGRLLAGINGPTSGSVRMGGVELMRVPLADLRRNVALVTQESHVFVGTLADNLRLAAENSSDLQLKQALKAVGAWRWVKKLPAQLLEQVGSGGVPLTPAQAQQVALARLILLDPQTVVLDEATSLIDPTAARGLEQGLSKVLAGRTVVAIAHRLQTAKDADRVILLEDGRITEQGSHDELLGLGGHYAALWHSWHGEG